MTLADLANLGEFLGGVAVVVSLVYLAMQVRQNSRQVESNTGAVEASAILETTRLRLDFDARIAADPALVEIWDVGHTSPSRLAAEQKRRFVFVVAQLFVLMDGLYALNQRGVLPDDTWAVQEVALAGLLQNPLIRSFLESGVTPIAPPFRRLIENLIARPLPGGAWRYIPLATLGTEERGERTDSGTS